ncbi:MAG: amidohydrolase [Chloroflexi bacterium HGW-Chloroflexi-3]|nr:MAG: amidohydrolase [Chloroflexi bacterium HGW-Chloroflexi-3]
MTENKLFQLANENFNYSVSFRRDFHQHPELGFQEIRTSEIIAKELINLNFEVKKNIGKTGVLGVLKGTSDGPTLLLRFDMDALPIHEENTSNFASKNEGIMHACGHDGHMAIGLTIAKILSTFQDQLNGTIKIIFQPAEEGLGGALATIEDGVLENPRPDYCLGLHIWNEKPLGWIGVNSGSMMASADTFEIIVNGKGGHGGLPHQATDPIVCAAQIISTIQTIVSRNISPLDNAVVSFGSIKGGSTFNVIPDSVYLTGTIRTFDPQIRFEIIKHLEKISKSVGDGMGCKIEFSLDEVTPAVINNSKIATDLQHVIQKLFPSFSVDLNFKTMGSEDFSYFLNKVPGCFYFVGSANPDKNLIYGHHHPRFDFDEGVLPIAVASLLCVIEEFGCLAIQSVDS